MLPKQAIMPTITNGAGASEREPIASLRESITGTAARWPITRGGCRGKS